MANNDIRQKIVLDGEKEYKSALRDAQRELKTLKSELKASTAELGKNATEQQKAEVRQKNLTKQIREQEKVVATYRKALAEVKENYADNADEIAKWQNKLNDARATLANMKNSLDDVGNGFKAMQNDAAMATVATKSVADALGSIADVGNTVSGAIEGIFSGMISVVKDAVTAVWGEVMDLAARANAWGDIAAAWNTSAANVEKWDRAVTGATKDFAALQNAVLRLNNLDEKQQKKITELTQVSGENFSDRWEYAMTVLGKMAGMDYDKRLEAIEAIFGSKQAGGGITEIINGWDTIQENLKLFDTENGGIGVTEEQINTLTQLDEKVAKLQQTWQAFVDSFAATHLAKLSLDLVGDAQVILDDLIKYLDTGSDEDLKQLETDIETFFNRIVEAIQAAAEKLKEAGQKLSESDNGIVRTIGQIITGIADALQWISDPGNLDKVLAAFEGIIGLWTGAKIVGVLSNLASFATNIKTLMGSTGAAAAAAGEAVGGGWGTGFAAAAVAALKAVPWIAGIMAVLWPSGGDSDYDTFVTPDGKLTTAGRAAGLTEDDIADFADSEIVEKAAETTGKQNQTKKGPKTYTGKDLAPNMVFANPTLAFATMVLGDKTETGRVARNGGSTEDIAKAAVDEIKTGAEQAVNNWVKYLTEDIPNAMWGAVGIKKQDLQRAANYAQIAGTWTFSDELTPEEAAAIAGAATIEEAESILSGMRESDYHSAPDRDTGYYGDDWSISDILEDLESQTVQAEETNKRMEEAAEWLTNIIMDKVQEVFGPDSGWWSNPNGESSDDGITGSDLEGFRGLPAGIITAVKKGAAEGVAGIKVSLDGYQVGRLVAPYVSEQIAAAIGG